MPWDHTLTYPLRHNIPGIRQLIYVVNENDSFNDPTFITITHNLQVNKNDNRNNEY